LETWAESAVNRAMRNGSSARETVWVATKPAEHGFTFVELIIATAMFIVAVGVAVVLGGVGGHKPSSDRDTLRGLLIRARTEAMVSRTGSALTITPNPNGGTDVTFYPQGSAADSTLLRAQWTVTLDETVADEYGRTSVAIIFERSGAASPAWRRAGEGKFARLGCPSAISLTTTSGEGLINLDPPLQVDCRSGRVAQD
jgi:Tfp pilus assembly protein FimT